jgi:hypothetical protein
MAGELTGCVVCGCTVDRACQPDGCTWWVWDPALCSACGKFLQNVRSVRRAFAILKACDVRRGARAILVALEIVRKPRRRRRSR